MTARMSRLALCLALSLTACRTAPRLFAIETPTDDTIRQTTSGAVRGGTGNHGSNAWLGIPFAAAPVGDLRWRAPTPPTAWAATRDTLKFGAECPQLPAGLSNDTEVHGSEDCLFLNVWAPPKADKLPVMFWIHGGGNSIGSANIYDGAHLATAQKVIVISAQYRLGPLGWFHHPALTGDANDASGNFGTLDLVRALEWVRDNAAAFGGDPDNVTIFGESAGGFDVYTLLLSPNAKGLFHRAIAESGLLAHFSLEQAEHWNDDAVPGHLNSSREVLARLMITDGKAKDRAAAKTLLDAMPADQISAYLRAKPPVELIKAYAGGRGLGMLDAPLLFGDGTVLPNTDWAEQLGKPGGWNKVPVIVGTNKEEMKLFLFLNPKYVYKKLGFLPRAIDDAKYQVTAEAGSRVWKWMGADQPAAAMVASGQSDVFVYRFDWRGQKSAMGTDLSSLVGAAHAMEIPFVFGDFGGPLSRLYQTDDTASRNDLSDTMMTYWATFARTGNPGKGAGALPEWKAWDASNTEAPKFIVLDVGAGGGVRMSSQIESLPRIVADLKADTRLTDPKTRCQVFHELAVFTRTEAKQVYEKVAAEICADYAFDAYPWDAK